MFCDPLRRLIVIGAGIALVVLGAIAAFALHLSVTWLDTQLLGYILLGAGLIVLILGIIFSMRRRTTTYTVRNGVDPASGESFTTRSESDTPLP
jgi:hypothetical protein